MSTSTTTPAASATATTTVATPTPATARTNNIVWLRAEPFVLGGLAGIGAISIVQPFDYVKVQKQLSGEGLKGNNLSTTTVIKQTLANKGVGEFWTGISAAWLRQATYTTARLGIYNKLTSTLTVDNQPLPFIQKAACGLTAGALGSIVGTPSDVSLTRMQADVTLPPHQRRHYANVFDAIVKIVKEDGPKGLFKGCSAVMLRAMALNSAMLATHDEAVERLTKMIPSQPLLANFSAKMIAGFCASVASLPFDFVKTRVQKQQPLPDGTLYYRSFAHCVTRVLREEGASAFFKGFGTYYVRIAPCQILTLIFYEQLINFSKQWTH